MKETTLLKIALICSLIGLFILYFVSTKIEVNEYRANALNKDIGEDAKLTGTVTKINDKGNVVFIEVNQQNLVTVVLFKYDGNLKFNTGDYIEVIGKIQEYNGKNEIIAQKMRVIKK